MARRLHDFPGMEGTAIGGYRVLYKLGEGGMGAVYVAEHLLLGRRAAIKVLLPMYSRDEPIVRRFFNEARAVTSVSDPGIVQLFDFGFHTDNSAYLVMELLEGESLDARLRRTGKLAPVDAVRMIRQCASSLAVAHARGIIHRDLKPENLFVVGDPAVTGGERVKILDFGIAKLGGDGLATSKTATGMLVGTPFYMSPEQCRGAADIDPRSDIYSLGCVLFALLSGRPPFSFDNSGELIAAHLREPPPCVTSYAPNVPAELDAVVQACLAKSPADRFASMSALVDGLDRVAGLLWAEPSGAPVRPSSVTHATPALTTLRGANGEVRSAVEPRRRRALVVAVVAISCVATGILSVSRFATTTVATPPVATSPAAVGSSSPDAAVADVATPDASPVDAATAGAATDPTATDAAVTTVDVPSPRRRPKHSPRRVPPPVVDPFEEDDHAPTAPTAPTAGSGSAVIDRSD